MKLNLAWLIRKCKNGPKLQMTEEIKPSVAKPSDHEIFLQGVAEFERVSVKQRRVTIVEIAMVLAALIAPFLLARMFAINQVAKDLVLDGCLILLLICLGCDLVRQRQTKAVLASQMKISARQHRRADKLYGLSILDPLTALHNRRFGEQRLQEEIERAEKEREPLAVVLFDLDYFKDINDKFGHAAGDLALKEFSRRLQRAIRACDVPVRMGGDEFLVLLPDCPRTKVDAILSRVGVPEIELNGQRIAIGYSTGRAHYQFTDTREILLGRADESLYLEKVQRHRDSTRQRNSLQSAAGQEAAAAENCEGDSDFTTEAQAPQRHGWNTRETLQKNSKKPTA